MKLIVVSCLILLTIKTVAQDSSNRVIDSLQKRLYLTKQDTTRVALLNEIAFTYGGLDLLQAKAYATQALRLAEKVKWSKGIAEAARYLGSIHLEAGERVIAEPYLQQALQESKKIGDVEGQVLCLYNLGSIHQHQSDYLKASNYYFSGIRLATAHASEGSIALGNYFLSTLFADQGDYKKTAYFANKALPVAKQLQDYYYTGAILEIIGYNEAKQKKYQEALVAFEEAIRAYVNINHIPGKAKILSNIADCYPKNPAMQLHYIRLSDEAWTSLGTENTIYAISNIAKKGTAYYKLWKSPSLQPDSLGFKQTQLATLANEYLKQGIEKLEQNNYIEPLIEVYNTYASFLQDRSNYKEALMYYTKSTNLKDSVYSQENKNKLAYIESQREIEIRDNQIKLNELALTNSRRTSIALISGAVLLFIIGSLLLYQNRLRQKANTQLLALNSQLNEANTAKIKFFGILSHDLRSPIASLINFLHLQNDTPALISENEKKKLQQHLSQSAESLLDTMEAMLLWSKSQMEHFSPQIKPIAVDTFFKYIEKQFSNKPSIHFLFSNTNNLIVHTDEDYLKTILYNLTANAQKALYHTNHPVIEWSARQEGAGVVLAITDNGPGLQIEQLEALYNENAVVGTRNGLGLHLVRDLAKAIQCTIRYEFVEGKGSVFLLTLQA